MKHVGTRKTMIILFWLAVWQAAAAVADNRILLVGPVQVLQAFCQNIVQPGFGRTVGSSLVRIGAGFFAAFGIGLLSGALGYRFRLVEELAAPVVQAIKSVPVASFVVLLLIWFGSGRLAFCISLLIVFPHVYVSTIAGLKSADAGLLETARVYGMNRRNRFFYIYRPALMPYLDSCLRISLGMSWKSGVAAEVIGLPEHSLGERLYMAKIYLDTAGLFAWTLAVILLSFVFEKAVLRLVRAYGEWRPYPMGGVKERSVSGKKKGPPSVRESVSGVRESVSGERESAPGVRKGVLSVGKSTHAESAGTEAAHDGTAAVMLSGICKAYDGRPVLRDYSLTMEAGGRYVLTAPSGAGKTTLLRILTGLDKTDAGRIAGMPERIGMVFQEDRLCEDCDAVCNIMLGMRRPDAGRVIREAAAILPEDCLNQPVSELSGGMRRRVALLRAVLSDAPLLLLDEPFTGLDEDNRARTAAYLLDRLAGRTLLVTTHCEQDVELLQGSRVVMG